MTPKQKANHVASLKEFFRRKGWEEDKRGNFCKEVSTPPPKPSTKKVRYVFTPVALRREVYIPGGVMLYGYKEPGRWVRSASGYLKDITITPEDKLSGLTSQGCGN